MCSDPNRLDPIAMEPRLICLIGAECTGKTTLVQALAQHLQGLWVPEYLRRFTSRHGRTPDREEQLRILQEQVRLETEALQAARQQGFRWVFCDTAPLLTAVYSDCVFADTSLYAPAHTLHARYALTLLLEPDIPWVADGVQRDGVEARARVHAALETALKQTGLPYTRIAGGTAQRVSTAVDAVLSVTP